MGPGQKSLKKGLDVYLLMVIILNSRFPKKFQMHCIYKNLKQTLLFGSDFYNLCGPER